MRPVRRAGWVWAKSGAPAEIKTAWDECTCAGAARMHSPLVLSCGVSLGPVSPAQCDEARRVEVQYRVSVRGALCLSSSLFKPLKRRSTAYVTNRDINPGYIDAFVIND